MYKEKKKSKHYTPARKIKQKCLIIAIASIIWSILAVYTVAFVFTQTNEVKNTFTTPNVASEIVEDFDGILKKDVVVKNTGEVQSYIRAKVVVVWMSEDQTQVYSKSPVENVDYEIVYANFSSNWGKASDGYWYYKIPVEPQKSTENLIDECKLLGSANVPDGYYLSVEIIASAIQSTPNTVVTENWESGVSGISATDGKTLIIKH